MLKKSLILFFALVYIFFGLIVNAQIKSEDISLSINPRQPKPGETVYASLSSFVADLNKTMISWSINGQTIAQGIGEKKISFKTDSSGSQIIIDIKIDNTDGTSINKQAVINPVSIDVLWESMDSYTPPFYKGKTLVPAEGVIKVVALLNSNKSNGVSYNWKLDNNTKLDSSGYGKNFYVFKKSYLDINNTVEVNASNLLGNSAGSGNIEIPNYTPKILFYKKDQNIGTHWEKSLEDDFPIDKQGETIVVEPYFMSPKNINNSAFKLTWTLGDSSITTPSIKNEIRIKPESTGGSSFIKVSVEDINKMFLNISRKINVNF